jgi:hypothetical protein
LSWNRITVRDRLIVGVMSPASLTIAADNQPGSWLGLPCRTVARRYAF